MKSNNPIIIVDADAIISQIYEADKNHLKNTLASYMKISEKFPEEFKIIECLKNNAMLPPETIAGKINQLVNELI